MKTISILGTENVVVIHGYGYRGVSESWDADEPQAVAMVENGKYDRYVVDCACGCSHYINSDGYNKWAPSDYCDDHSYMREE